MPHPPPHAVFVRVLQSMDIMADKGFYISNLLFRRGCGLLQPIEKPKLKRYSRSALLFSRRVSHVRIHIERMVRRVNARCGWLHKLINMNQLHLVWPVTQICSFHANFRTPLRS